MVEVPLIAAFIENLSGERNLSRHTVRSYRADLKQFCRFLTVPPELWDDSGMTIGRLPPVQEADAPTLSGRLLSVSPNDVRAYLAMMRNSMQGKSSIARRLATLRSFYKYLVRKGRLEGSPVSIIRTPKQDKRLPTCLDLGQVEALMTAPDVNTLLGARDRAILETIYSGGLRIGELVALNLGDIDEFAETARVAGKGKKERLAPMGSQAMAALKWWLEKRQAAFGPAGRDDPLFLNRMGRRPSSRLPSR